MRRPLRHTKAFSLIELLVVVSIISLLIALLLPAMGRVRLQTRQLQCATQLRQWGTSLAAYFADHRNRVNETTGGATFWGGRYPSLYPYTSEVASALGIPDALAAKPVEQYLPTNTKNVMLGQLSGFWFCPDNVAGGGDLQALSTQGSLPGLQTVQTHYSFFGQVGRWEAHATQPQQLTTRSLDSSRVLMADEIFRWGGTWWAFNHGKSGPVSHWGARGIAMESGTPSIRGNNRLFGDGHVNWITREQLNIPALTANSNAVGWVIGGFGTDRTAY